MNLGAKLRLLSDLYLFRGEKINIQLVKTIGARQFYAMTINFFLQKSPVNKGNFKQFRIIGFILFLLVNRFKWLWINLKSLFVISIPRVPSNHMQCHERFLLDFLGPHSLDPWSISSKLNWWLFNRDENVNKMSPSSSIVNVDCDKVDRNGSGK